MPNPDSEGEAPLRVEVVIPVYNEEHVLAQSVANLRAFLSENVPYDWQIVVADNASTDRTLDVAKRLEAEDPRVRAIHLDRKGRGRALKKAWLESDADVVSYMDVDLSTNLAAFPELVRLVAEGSYDVAIGNRLMAGARTTRQWKREVISRSYNLLIKLLFPHRSFTDAQCGFKALSRRAADRLVPSLENNGWFLDSELLLRAEEVGYKIAEVPVEWVEDLDSRVNVVATATEDIKGLLRVRLNPLADSFDRR